MGAPTSGRTRAAAIHALQLLAVLVTASHPYAEEYCGYNCCTQATLHLQLCMAVSTEFASERCACFTPICLLCTEQMRNAL